MLFFCTQSYLHAQDRRANEIEAAYSFLSAQLLMPELCEKISARAYISAGLAPRGEQIYYLLSDCYFKLALTTHNQLFCDKVVKKKHWWLSGSRFTSESCRAEVSKGDISRAVGGDPELINALIKGKDTTDLDNNDRADGYILDTEIKKALPKLPDFSKSSPLSKDSSFKNLGCLDGSDPHWICKALRCLDIDTEGIRENCLEKAFDLRVSQISR